MGKFVILIAGLLVNLSAQPPQRLKPSASFTYRSAEALRHPKANTGANTSVLMETALRL
jgi:hypothetical protein